MVASVLRAIAAMRLMSVGDRIVSLVADLDGVAELRWVRPTDQVQRAVLAEEHLDRDPLAGAWPDAATTYAGGTGAVVVDVAHRLVEVVAGVFVGREQIRFDVTRHFRWPPVMRACWAGAVSAGLGDGALETTRTREHGYQRESDERRTASHLCRTFGALAWFHAGARLVEPFRGA